VLADVYTTPTLGSPSHRRATLTAHRRGLGQVNRRLRNDDIYQHFTSAAALRRKFGDALDPEYLRSSVQHRDIINSGGRLGGAITRHVPEGIRRRHSWIHLDMPAHLIDDNRGWMPKAIRNGGQKPGEFVRALHSHELELSTPI